MSITYPNTNIYITNGITGTTITSSSITTPTLSVNNIVDSFGSTGANGNVLSSTNDGIKWIGITGTSTEIGITGNLDMNTYDITNAGTIDCTNLNATTINTTTFTNQITFASTPSCSTEPTAANHIVNKNYVDTRTLYTVYNLYLHQSQTTTVPLASGSTGYSKLSNLVIATVQASPLARTITAGTTGGILSFISDPINITQLPACLLNVNMYGNNITTNVNIYYSCNFRLYSGTGSGITITTLGNSQSSSILRNTTAYPLLYTMPVSILSRTTLPTDRFIIELYAINTSASDVTLHNYFENKFYSYAQLQLNSVSPLQLFTNYILNTASSDLNMNNFNITSDGNLDISSPNKILTIGNKASTINIEKQASGNIYLGSTNSTINLSKSLTIDYILNNNIYAIGYTFSLTPSNSTMAFNSGATATNLSRVTIPYKGVWFFTFSGGINMSSQTMLFYYYHICKNNSAALESNFICGRKITQTKGSPATVILNCSGVVDIPSSNILLITQFLRRSNVTGGGVASLNKFYFIRIA